jgi:uncharacterized membrane protein
MGCEEMRRYRLIWLIMALVCFTATVAPVPLLAQKVTTDLVMNLIPYYNARTVPGQDNRAYLEIRNIGNTAINHIKLTAEIPEGWTLEFSPGNIDLLNAGAVQTIDLNIRPPQDTREDDYRINIIAQADELRKVQTFFVNVRKPTTYWLWVGGALGVVIIAVFVVIFLRMSKK